MNNINLIRYTIWMSLLDNGEVRNEKGKVINAITASEFYAARELLGYKE